MSISHYKMFNENIMIIFIICLFLLFKKIKEKTGSQDLNLYVNLFFKVLSKLAHS